jgi:hypothetical protein
MGVIIFYCAYMSAIADITYTGRNMSYWEIIYCYIVYV